MAETLKMKDVFTVTIKDENDPRKILEEFQLAVVRPNNEQIKKGQNIYNETYSDRKSGCAGEGGTSIRRTGSVE
jgi:hypothetical protein